MDWSTPRKPNDDEYYKIMDMQDQAELLLRRQFDDFIPVQVRTWETINLNYLVKVLIDRNTEECLHMMIFKNPKGKFMINKIEAGKTFKTSLP